MNEQAKWRRTALRLPPDLHTRIHATAAEATRSFNAEIVDRLHRSFVEPTTTSSHGMSLRDYFAAKAMQSALNHPACGELDEWLVKNAQAAYAAADTMLEARKQ